MPYGLPAVDVFEHSALGEFGQPAAELTQKKWMRQEGNNLYDGVDGGGGGDGGVAKRGLAAKKPLAFSHQP
ncbi:MAG: hypothetical protein K8L97_09035 [Anaerolineae bacterium]|nr:hypothetical protein [Anaerolineae bacterium]